MTVTREGAGGTTAVCAWCESIPGSNYLPHEPRPNGLRASPAAPCRVKLSPQPWGTRSQLLTRPSAALKTCGKILSQSRKPDRPIPAKTPIVPAGIGRCAIYLPWLSGQCVSPANTGWDWLEFRRGNGASGGGLSSAAPAIAPKKYPSL